MNRRVWGSLEQTQLNIHVSPPRTQQIQIIIMATAHHHFVWPRINMFVCVCVCEHQLLTLLLKFKTAPLPVHIFLKCSCIRCGKHFYDYQSYSGFSLLRVKIYTGTFFEEKSGEE